MRHKRNKRNTETVTRTALCTAMLCAASYLVVPLPFTPVVLSMHTVMVNLIGLVCSPKEAARVVGLYLLMGLVGLPVFSGGTGGPGKLFGPTGGFYFGFLLGAAAISALKGKKPSFWRYLAATAGVGLPIEHLCAILMMGFHNSGDLRAAVLTVSFPFLPGDVVKCVIAATVGDALRKAMSPHG